MRRHRLTATRALTLPEVVIVVALISILATLLFPSLQHGLQTVRRVQCQNHLRQWTLATYLYTTDHEGFLPTDGAPNGSSRESGWYIALPRQLGLLPYHTAIWRTNPQSRLPRSPWFCPANQRRSNGHNLFHYCLNQHINGSGSGNQVKLDALPDLDQLIWLFDNGKQAAVAQHNNVHTNVHSAGANISFLDGHIEHRSSADYWDYPMNRGRTDVKGLRWRPGR